MFMDSELRPSSKDGKNEIPKSTLDASTEKDDPLAKQPTKDELNEPRVNEGCVALNTNREKQTKEYAPSSLFTNAVTYKMKHNIIQWTLCRLNSINKHTTKLRHSFNFGT